MSVSIRTVGLTMTSFENVTIPSRDIQYIIDIERLEKAVSAISSGLKCETRQN
ncbi:unnamed protein product, partial [Rotaria magnacalcarata]